LVVVVFWNDVSWRKDCIIS